MEERRFSTFLVALALTLAVSSCLVLAQSNETTTQVPSNPSEPVRNDTFILREEGKVCLRMTAAIIVNITYINSTGQNTSLVLPLTNDAEVNASDSTCSRENAKALLSIVPKVEDEYPGYYVLFNFTGSSANNDKHWGWGNISFGVDTLMLDMEEDRGMVDFTTDMALHGDPNSRVEFQRSYVCNTNQEVRFPKDHNIQAFIYVSQLQVQAFSFKNDTSGEFDNARTCLLDSSGKANKIVPIAVGAALAGLVIVVLIAYLIGRLRSRRQSSYEALS